MVKKPTRSVFVIMPFGQVDGGPRSEELLTAFFENHIKQPIEGADHLAHRYLVTRSGEAFNITAEIIRELCRADIVIADLSGKKPNPNVMYELGVRLAISELPVVLIKEETGSGNPFDILSYYTKTYNSLDYAPLTEHLLQKLARLETGEEGFENNVLSIVREELALLTPDVASISPDRQRGLVMNGIRSLTGAARTAFGPHGLALQQHGGETLTRRGHRLALGLTSKNPFEQEGIQLIGRAGRQMTERVGDGSKLAMLITGATIERLDQSAQGSSAPRQIAEDVRAAARLATETLSADYRQDVGQRWFDVFATAAKLRTPPVDVAGLLDAAGADLMITVEAGDGPETQVVCHEHYVLDRGAVHEDLLTEEEETQVAFDDCLVLLFSGAIVLTDEIVPVLEEAVARKKALLLVAETIQGDALAVLRLNVGKGRVRCAAVSLPGGGDRHAETFKDLAALTGATLIEPEQGFSLASNAPSSLGTAQRVVISRHSTEIIEGTDSREAVVGRIDNLRARAADTDSDFDREMLQERIARLAGSHFTVRAGGDTVEERLEVQTALNEGFSACESARETGVVVGGVSALVRVAEVLTNLETSGEQRVAFDAVAAGLQAPLRALVENAGQDPNSVIAELKKRGTEIYDAGSRTTSEAADTGILDPLGVMVDAVRIAAGTAAKFLQTGTWSLPSAEEPFSFD